MIKVGVIGLGTVGETLYKVFSLFHEVVGYDLKKPSDPKRKLLDTDISIITVPTHKEGNRGLYTGTVASVLNDLEDIEYRGVVCIKSTVPPGFMNRITNDYSFKLVYSPEFMRSDLRRWGDVIRPEFLVVSPCVKHSRIVEEAYTWVRREKIHYVSYQTAELVKLGLNAFGATKVSFTNELARVSDNPEKVLQLISSSSKCSEYYMNPALGPYGGTCLPKDTRELSSHIDSSLLEVVDRVNEEVKEEWKS